MKKLVLLCSAAVVCFAASAQNRLAQPSKAARPVNHERKLTVADENQPRTGKSKPNTATARHGHQAGNTTQAVITLGTAANALTAIRTHNYLWADPTMQLVTFTHRAVGTTSGTINSGRYFYDINHNNGVGTWDTTQGPIYVPSQSTVRNPSNGRYPQAAVYNPAGTSNYGDAYLSYYGCTLDSTNLSLSQNPVLDWGGNVWGVYKLDGSMPHTQHEIISDSSLNMFYVIPEMFHMCKNGKTVGLSESDYGNSDLYTSPVRGTDYDYNNQMIFQWGSWNAAANDYMYNWQMFNVPSGELPYNRWYSYPGASSNTDPVSTMIGSNIVFDDNGQIGYMVCKMFRYTWEAPDSNALYYIYKTTDGGATWHETMTPDLDGCDTLLADSGFATGISGSSFDIMMDANNNLHIITNIGTDYIDPNYGTSDTYYDVYGSIFDIYTTDGGNTWRAHRLKTGQIHEIYGVMGDPATASARQTYDNRPQITRSYDGSKLFFSWFETDTVSWPPLSANSGYNNQHPDMHVVGLDVNTNMWTIDSNMTAYPALGGLADGACLLGSVSYYALDNGSGGYMIPTVIGLNLETSTNNNPDWQAPFTFEYVEGVEVPASAYTVASSVSNDVLLNSMNFVTATNNLTINGDFVVSPVRPNPVQGISDLLVSIGKPGNITVEVRNVLGQVVSSVEYSNQSNGLHKYEISSNKLTSGIYLCTVKYNGQQHTQKITVQ